MIDLERILPIPVHPPMLQVLLHERWELMQESQNLPFEDSEKSEYMPRGTPTAGCPPFQVGRQPMLLLILRGVIT